MIRLPPSSSSTSVDDSVGKKRLSGSFLARRKGDIFGIYSHVYLYVLEGLCRRASLHSPARVLFDVEMSPLDRRTAQDVSLSGPMDATGGLGIDFPRERDVGGGEQEKGGRVFGFSSVGLLENVGSFMQCVWLRSFYLFSSLCSFGLYFLPSDSHRALNEQRAAGGCC